MMDTEVKFGKFIPMVDNTDDAVRESLQEILETLSDREKKVLDFRFGLTDHFPRTLEETGKLFNVSREYVRQVQDKALAKLKDPKRVALARRLLDELNDEPLNELEDKDVATRVREVREAFGKVMNSFCKFAFFPKMVARLLDGVKSGEMSIRQIALDGVDEEKYFERIPVVRKSLLEVGDKMMREKENPQNARCEFWDILCELRLNTDAVLKIVSEAEEGLFRPYKAIWRQYAASAIAPQGKGMPEETSKRKEIIEKAIGLDGNVFLREFDALIDNANNLAKACGMASTKGIVRASDLFN